jgi:hypothetical protein
MGDGEGLRLCRGHQKEQEEKEIFEDRHRAIVPLDRYFAALNARCLLASSQGFGRVAAGTYR